MAGPLNDIIAAIKADPGLKASISAAKIQKGVKASDLLNDVLLQMIAQTNVNADGQITAGDMKKVSDELWKDANAAPWRDFWRGHGNDNGDVVSGFHHVQNDGGTLLFQGRNFIDTVADAIYHYGFKVKNGRYFNEDGNANETLADVAGWLNYFLNGVNIVYGTGRNDELGSGTYSRYFSAARSETFLAGDGNDRVWADVGNDKVMLGAGNDESGGGSGNDRMFGEAGRDKFWGEDGRDFLYGGGGNDMAGGGDAGDKIDGGAGNDTLYGGNGSDGMTGGDDGDKIYGENGSDRLQGGNGRDELSGGEGKDRLFGQGANDKLYSGDGADTLNGGTGADSHYLWENGASRDTLVFALGDSTQASMDVVEGFQSGTDKIDLSALGPMVFRKTPDYRGGGDGSCYYVSNGENSRLMIDADGDMNTDMVIGFKWVDLRAGDFIFG